MVANGTDFVSMSKSCRISEKMSDSCKKIFKIIKSEVVPWAVENMTYSYWSRDGLWWVVVITFVAIPLVIVRVL